MRLAETLQRTLEQVGHGRVDHGAHGVVAARLLDEQRRGAVDAGARRAPQRDVVEVALVDQAALEPVVDVVRVVGDAVGCIHDLRLEAERRAVLDERGAHLGGQVQPRELRVLALQQVDDAERLAVVLETTVFAHRLGQGVFARMAERTMSEVMR